MRAILAALADGSLPGEAVLAVSNRPDAPALAAARACGVTARVIPTLRDPEAADRRLAEALLEAKADLVILSGYLRRLGPATLAAFAGRILNIHPGPLPDFGGEGMNGRHVHEAVIAAGLPASEICVHVVDAVYDHGPVLARLSVPVEAGDTAETLEQRVTAAEPAFFVETLRAIADGRLALPSGPDRAKSGA